MSLFHDIVNEVSGVNRINDAKQTRKDVLFFIVVGTLLISLCCLGIMYLRFRVFGG